MNPLPSNWVDSLFARLLVTYGRPFLAQYEGLDENAIKAEWAKVLSGFQRSVDDHIHLPAIAWALENLPARPPTLLEFRDICRGYREPDQIALPAPPREIPERFKTAIAQLAVPLEDTRPEPVRRAYSFINKWGTPGVRLNPTQQQWLQHYRGIASRWEADLAKDAEAARAKEVTHADQ